MKDSLWTRFFARPLSYWILASSYFRTIRFDPAGAMPYRPTDLLLCFSSMAAWAVGTPIFLPSSIAYIFSCKIRLEQSIYAFLSVQMKSFVRYFYVNLYLFNLMNSLLLCTFVFASHEFLHVNCILFVEYFFWMRSMLSSCFLIWLFYDKRVSLNNGLQFERTLRLKVITLRTYHFL